MLLRKILKTATDSCVGTKSRGQKQGPGGEWLDERDTGRGERGMDERGWSRG